MKAATRGDGVTGEEVTAQVKTIAGVPRTISYTGRIEIQGEGIMRLSALAAYNAKSDEPLKNARNGAAGAIRNLDPAVTASRNLSFMAYNIGYSDRHFASQREMHDFLAEEGFETESDFTVLKGADAAFAFAEKVGELRPTLDFLIDGVVFKVNDTALRDEIGYTEKFPKWAIAYKFKADEMTTVLRDVVWQVSRSAKLNPLAVLDPVDIGGVTVQRATLNNYGDILKKKVKIGDRVFIRRSNDVIPEIMGVAEEAPDAKEVEKPTVCPACGAPVREEGGEEQRAHPFVFFEREVQKKRVPRLPLLFAEQLFFLLCRQNRKRRAARRKGEEGGGGKAYPRRRARIPQKPDGKQPHRRRVKHNVRPQGGREFPHAVIFDGFFAN